MKLEIYSTNSQQTCDIDALAEQYSGAINLGRRCEDVWNAIALYDETTDPFQCHLIGCVGGPWRLHHGQNRTNCPKGLKSDKLIPCNSCEGPCRNGKPKYPNRMPQMPTLINGKPVSDWGTYLNAGDEIRIGETVIRVE